MQTGEHPLREPDPQIPEDHGNSDYDRDDQEDLSSAMELAHQALRPPDQEMEFVAKVLYSSQLRLSRLGLKGQTARVILGTPLYVAQVHPKPEDDDIT